MENDINVIYNQLISEMKLPTKTYHPPFIITMCGHCRSGKSTIAKILSSELELYIIGGDKIRNIYYSNINANHDIGFINKVVNEVNKKEIKYLLSKGVSVIIDRSVSSKKVLKEIKDAYPHVIMINLVSDHKTNIARMTNPPKCDIDTSNCYGDIDSISGVNNEDVYNEILNRKVYDLDDSDFDYTIDATKSLDDVINEARKMALQIKNQYL